LPAIIDTPSNREAMPDADHNTWTTVDSLIPKASFINFTFAGRRDFRHVSGPHGR
jgi:hypothetical protein